jgi:TetR/AcrR family transcriptional repressor of nem operon
MARPKAFDQDKALQKAMHIFWDKGYDGTSMSDLTAAMGLSRSSLYETFGDKQDLFHAALEHYIRVMDLKRARLFAKAGSAQQGLRDYFRGAVDFVLSEDHPVGCFYTNTAIAHEQLDKRVQGLIKQGMDKQEEDFYRLLADGKKNHTLGPDKESRSLAKFFVGLIRGIGVVARIHQDRKTLDEIMQVGLKVLD